MKDSLSNENSFIFDRNWEKVNPKNQLTVSVDQAKLFLKMLIEDYERLKKINDSSIEDLSETKIMDKIQLFLFKYIQEKQLSLSAKRQLPSIQKAPYRLSLNDCLEIWRWLSEDSTSYKTKQTAYDESMDVNEFEMGNNFEAIEIKKNVDYSSKNKKSFKQLSLEEQELVLKKSLEMVHLYYFQFKIIFNHYCRFTIENQHKRTNTFDDVTHSLQKLTINRFMLFCREFDIIKTLQFKRRTEHNPSMSKQFLMKVFKKSAHLQRFLIFQSFLMTLVNISIKIHENFDPRSYMHMELFLNSLKVKYYEQFVHKLDSLQIKYSPTEFYNCYRHIFNKQSIKKKKDSKKTLFNNPYLTKQEITHEPVAHEGNLMANQSTLFKQPKNQSRLMKSHQSVPNLLAVDYGLDYRMKKGSQTLQKRKVSVPVLPSLQENRYFKPIEHNHHLNSYNKYLQRVEDTSSVFKNRITGYSNINNLKSKGFHTHQNPEAVSKDVLDHLLAKKKQSIHKDRQENSQYQTNENSSLGKNMQNKILSNESLIRQHLIVSSDSVPEQKRIPTITASKLFKKDEKKQALQSLKKKIDISENDQLLNKHLIAQYSKQRQSEKAGNIQKRTN